MAQLVCLHLGESHLLEDFNLLQGEVYTVGRDPESSIFLDLNDVSSKHAELGYSNDAWNIID